MQKMDDKGNFALAVFSGQDASSLILQPPNGRTPGAIFIVRQERICKLTLTDAVLTAHRSTLTTPVHTGIADKGIPPTPAVLNYNFVNDHVKPSVNTSAFSFVLEPTLKVKLKYLVNGVETYGEFTGFQESSAIEITRAMSNEILRVYDKVEHMVELAREKGLQLEVENQKQDIATIERIQQAELRRKNLSAVNPMERAKKVTKGFGSK